VAEEDPTMSASGPIGPTTPLPPEVWRWLAGASTTTLTTQPFKRGLRRMHMMGEAFTRRYIPVREDLDVVEVFQNPEHPSGRRSG